MTEKLEAAIAAVPGIISVERRSKAAMDSNNNREAAVDGNMSPILNCVEVLKCQYRLLTVLPPYKSREGVTPLIKFIIEKEDFKAEDAAISRLLGGRSFLFTKQRLKKLIDESVPWDDKVMITFCNIVIAKVNTLGLEEGKKTKPFFLERKSRIGGLTINKKFVVQKLYRHCVVWQVEYR